jgi:biopolymer transport protein ExbD
MSHKKKRGRKEVEAVHLGFQIAPMIDVVFVIMLFFMVMAGAAQMENGLNLKLPGIVPSDTPISVEETQVRISDMGEVLLNDEPVGEPGDTKLVNLTATMMRLVESAKAAAETKIVVTIVADEFAPYQRVINVLNSLAIAKVQNVTFEVPPQ